MKRKKTNLLFIAALVFAVGIMLYTAGLANATLISYGDPIDGNSWSQRFEESGVGNFDAVETFMITPGVDFEAPGFSAFSDGSWTGSLINPDYALGTGGPSTTYLEWNISFTSDQSESLVFDFFAWSGGVNGTLLEAARASWSGSGWSFTNAPIGVNYNRVPVPDASILLLIGPALISLGILGRRRKKV